MGINEQLSRREFLKLGAGAGLGLYVDKFLPHKSVLAKEASLENNLTFYFSETGHNLEGHFLEFWRTNGGELIFGDPITEMTNTGMPMQYFQKARLELHSNNQVKLGLLGSELYEEEKGFTPILDGPNTPKFSRFYNKRGGADIFGYPISPVLEEEGRLVQYFQRAKFEYHPEVVDPFYLDQQRINNINLLSLNEVQLANLGEIAANKKGISTAKVLPKEGAIDFSNFTPDKKIMIDLTEQRLFAYEGETPVIIADISSGRPSTPSPVGKFRVLEKVLEQPYRGIDPDTNKRYERLRVPHSLLYLPGGYNIHGAYWHDKFGKSKSYGVSLGCVNLDLDFAEQIYNWAQVGTPVEIYYS